MNYRVINLDMNEWLDPVKLGARDAGWVQSFAQESLVGTALALLTTVGFPDPPLSGSNKPWEMDEVPFEEGRMPQAYYQLLGRWWNNRLLIVSEGGSDPALEETTHGEQTWQLCVDPVKVQQTYQNGLEDFGREIRQRLGWNVQPSDLYYDITDGIRPIAEYVTGRKVVGQTDMFGNLTGRLITITDLNRSLAIEQGEDPARDWPPMPEWLEAYLRKVG